MSLAEIDQVRQNVADAIVSAVDLCEAGTITTSDRDVITDQARTALRALTAPLN